MFNIMQVMQTQIKDWVIACFGNTRATEVEERSDRFIEEVAELLQSLDYDKRRAHSLIEYVYTREKGEAFKETGGVMVTLSALCNATNVDIYQAFRTEIERITEPKKMEMIRQKGLAKSYGSELPIDYRPPYQDIIEAAQRVCRSIDEEAVHHAADTLFEYNIQQQNEFASAMIDLGMAVQEYERERQGIS